MNPTVARIAQIALIVIGLVGAFVHSIVDDDFALRFNFDLVAIAWIGVALLGLLLPYIVSAEIFGVRVDLRELEESADDLQVYLEQSGRLIEEWSVATAAFLGKVDLAESGSERAARISFFVEDRAKEARSFLNSDPGDQLRLAVWYQAAHGSIEFLVVVGGDEPTKKTYLPTEGLIGRAFLSGEVQNEPDVRRAANYLSTRSGDPPYLAVMCVPIKFAGNTLGVITIDKRSDGAFQPVNVSVVVALAALAGVALTRTVGGTKS